MDLSSLLVAASRVVAGVNRGRSATESLAGIDPALRPGAQAVSMHAMRRLAQARWARQRLAPRPPPPEVEALLLVALAMLWPITEGEAGEVYAEHTVVDQAVEAVRKLKPGAAAFVNAVLRRFVREREALVEQAQADRSVCMGHPGWWIDRVGRDWPRQRDELLRQARLLPPMTLRVNTTRGSVDAYLRELEAVGQRASIPSRPIGPGPHATLVLERPCPVTALPVFAEGRVSVQDAAAQVAAPLLLDGMPRGAGLRVLDACAAPGGKTAHLLETDPSLVLTAIDSDAQRLTKVSEGLARLGLARDHVHVRHGDVAEPAAWWDGQRFDAILLDAPCSASGIVRRHPDIPWLRRPGDIEALARTQARLLEACLGMLAPGGRLLYATCSVFVAEGQAQVDALLQRRAGRAPTLHPASPGHLLPLPDNPGETAVHDGFFYALLTV